MFQKGLLIKCALLLNLSAKPSNCLFVTTYYGPLISNVIVSNIIFGGFRVAHSNFLIGSNCIVPTTYVIIKGKSAFSEIKMFE